MQTIISTRFCDFHPILIPKVIWCQATFVWFNVQSFVLLGFKLYQLLSAKILFESLNVDYTAYHTFAREIILAQLPIIKLVHSVKDCQLSVSSKWHQTVILHG